MSYEDYRIGQEISRDYDSDQFYGLIQAAMRLADTGNLEKLRHAWPSAWNELQRRYRAPGGLLPGETAQCAAIEEVR